MCLLNYPRIFIFGQSFNNTTGGGITLSNLFKSWEKDSIAVAFASWWGEPTPTADVCDTYYQIGNEEHKWKFPFSIYKQKFPGSGLIINLNQNQNNNSVILPKLSIRNKFANRFINPILFCLGLNHSYSRITLSDRLKDWLVKFKPDILYIQVSSLEGIIFASQLIDFLKIPSIIHMMDDWPSTICMYGILKRYWKRKIDKELRTLLNKVDVHFSISKAMSEEYLIRYNKKFIPFHNPVETDIWVPYCKTDFTLNRSHVVILYSGRIGTTGVSNSLLDIASVIDSINYYSNDLNIKLHIQTPMQGERVLQLLQEYNCVVINPVADYNKIPEIFSKADILLLANDFDEKALKYLKLSMPTKASEYMISGTPVMVYSPEETAVSKFFKQNDCGYCITSRNKEEIKKAIHFLIENEEYRKKISRNAVNYAKEEFDAKKVRSKFQNLLINIASNV